MSAPPVRPGAVVVATITMSLGGGRRLVADVGRTQIRLEAVAAARSPYATHLRQPVGRWAGTAA